MSNEREPMNGDDRISATYRDLATERAPDTLDRRILAEARRGAATRYGMLRGWTRPVAWAAMIGISLAIVLQVSQTPETPVMPLDESSGPAEIGEPGAIRRSGKLREDAATAGKPAAPAAAGQETQYDQAQVKTPASLLKLMPAPAASKVASPETSNDSAEGLSATTADSAPGDEPMCPDSSRAEPADWLACIEALRNRGEIEAAARELERFRAAFPDFPVETPHK